MSSSNSPRLPSKRELLADLKLLAIEHPNRRITRDLYRGNGKFKETHWQKHFDSFASFATEAGLSVSKPATPTLETIEVVGNRLNISLPKTRIQTLDELLTHCKVDTSIWEVERWVCNKWEMGTAVGEQSNKTIIVEPLFQIKATLVRRDNIVAVKDELLKLKDEAKSYARVPTPVVRTVHRSGNMLEINVPDSHFGKLAWGRETGDRPYDAAIAEQTFLRAVETLIERSKGYKFEKVLFVVGNDLLNSDNMEGTTTKGTYVSTDGRYQKTFGVVRRTITKCIERLRQVAPVKVVLVSGNHDDLSVWHLGDSLECYFDRYEDVEVDNEPTYRKYHRHGNVLLMLTHGDKGRRTDYPLLMATERPHDFGETLFRETHTGHTHMTKLDEQHGVRVRVLPALCPPDAWHSENGFVGNQRNAEGYIWNEREGLIAQVFHNDDAYPVIKTVRDVVTQ
jgi:hypothetical protein